MNELLLSLCTLLRACTKQLCMWPCSLTENVRECRLFYPTHYLASRKKSIEQLRPSVPRQTSALELLVVYCFRTLLLYPCPLYYGMLNFIIYTWSLSYPPDQRSYEYINNLSHVISSHTHVITIGMRSPSTVSHVTTISTECQVHSVLMSVLWDGARMRGTCHGNNSL